MIYTDWKGNVIKEGDEICFIKTKTNPFIKKIGAFLPGIGLMGMTELANDDCWEVGEYLKVVRLSIGSLGVITSSNEYQISTTLGMLIGNKNDYSLIGIKGISDKKDSGIVLLNN